MKAQIPVLAAAGLALPLLISGCQLFPTTRHLPVPKAPEIVQTATPEDLVKRLDDRWDALQTLSVKVQIKASVVKASTGASEEEDEPAITAFILLSKPEFLRVYGQVPVVGTEMFNMVSDGKDFSLYIKPKGVAYEGSDTAKGTSKNPWENLRPPFFFDSMVVRGVNPANHYFVTSNTVTMEDVKKKHLYSMPEYILNINRVNPDSLKETPVRVVTFHRDDLLPYVQDIYDEKGDLETHVTYGPYENIDNFQLPSTITIRSPQAGIQLALTVESVLQKNGELKATEFEAHIPSGVKIEHLK
jgi:hypothetical protein